MKKSWRKTPTGYVRFDSAFQIVKVGRGLYELHDIGGSTPFLIETSNNLTKLKKDWDLN